MSGIIINLILVILASVYVGLIVGHRGNRKIIEERVREASRKVEEEAKLKQKDLAVEMHGELSTIRESIIDSAQAYQNVVKLVNDRLAPWDEVAGTLPDLRQTQLPLFIEDAAAASRDRASRSGPELPIDELISDEEDVSDTLPRSQSAFDSTSAGDTAAKQPETDREEEPEGSGEAGGAVYAMDAAAAGTSGKDSEKSEKDSDKDEGDTLEMEALDEEAAQNASVSSDEEPFTEESKEESKALETTPEEIVEEGKTTKYSVG